MAKSLEMHCKIMKANNQVDKELTVLTKKGLGGRYKYNIGNNIYILF